MQQITPKVSYSDCTAEDLTPVVTASDYIFMEFSFFDLEESAAWQIG